MKWIHGVSSGLAAFIAALVLASCAAMGGGDAVQVKMTGAEEVPPTQTSASGTGSVTVGEDGSVSGSFKTQGAVIMAAHIHEGAAGANGPVIIPLQKSGDNDWVVPPGAKFTPSQLASYKAGRTYVNFHTAKYKGGEIRAQLRPGGGARSGY